MVAHLLIRQLPAVQVQQQTNLLLQLSQPGLLLLNLPLNQFQFLLLCAFSHLHSADLSALPLHSFHLLLHLFDVLFNVLVPTVLLVYFLVNVAPQL